MVNRPGEYRFDTPLHSSYVILQTRTFNCKIVSLGIIFFLLILYFLCTPLHELAFYNLIYPLCLFPQLNHAFEYFNQIYATIYLMYP